MRTQWSCEWCGLSGEIEHDKHTDVWTVYEQIVSDHSQKSPSCVFDGSAVRIRIMKE